MSNPTIVTVEYSLASVAGRANEFVTAAITADINPTEGINSWANLAAVEAALTAADSRWSAIHEYFVGTVLERTLDEYIAKAAAVDVELDRTSFVIIDGNPTLDGMDPIEWLEAMTDMEV